MMITMMIMLVLSWAFLWLAVVWRTTRNRAAISVEGQMLGKRRRKKTSVSN